MINHAPLNGVVHFGLELASIAAAFATRGAGVLAAFVLLAIVGLAIARRAAERPPRPAVLRWLSAFARFRTP